jgi:hypothetical protein
MPTWEETERRQELAKLLARAAIRLQMNQKLEQKKNLTESHDNCLESDTKPWLSDEHTG